MKTILLLITATIFSINLFAQNFLVSIKGDTVFFNGDFEFKHQNSAKFKKIIVDGKKYPFNQIKSVQCNNLFYLNIDKKNLWKRVVTGKISVYALNDIDTIADNKGIIHRKLYIQKAGTKKIYSFENEFLLPMIKDDSVLYNSIRPNYKKVKRGKIIAFSFIPIAAISAFSQLFLVLIDDERNPYKTEHNISIVGIATGLSGVITGAAISSNSKKMSLDPIYLYNQK